MPDADDNVPAEDQAEPTEATPEVEQAEQTPEDEPAEPVAGEQPIASESGDAEPITSEPGSESAPSAPDAALVEGVSGGISWLPFAVYLAFWVLLAGLSAYFLYDATPEQPARWMPQYVPLLWSGVALTAFGPLLSLAVWLVVRLRRPKAERRGLFSSAMTRGALVAFFGVVLWLGTLFVLELSVAGWRL